MNNINISGSGTLISGNYDKIKISGSAKINGSIKCRSISCSGAVKGLGSIDCSEYIKCSGAIKINGNISSREIYTSGSVACGNDVDSHLIKVSGGLKINGSLHSENVDIAGGINVENDIECESIKIDGKVICKGLINAEKININSSYYSQIGNIGGSEININQKMGYKLMNCIYKLLNKRGRRLKTSLIEGDTIKLSCVEADIVRGKNIIIESGCVIGKIEYTETLTIGKENDIGEQVKNV